MAKSRVTKVNNVTKGVLLQSRKFIPEKWPAMIFAFESSAVSIPTEIEGIEIPQTSVNLISYVRTDLLSPEVMSELRNKIQMDKEIKQ
jgi:hypothetical protein